MSNYWDNVLYLLQFILVLVLVTGWLASMVFGAHVACSRHFHPLARVASGIYAPAAFILGLALAGTLIQEATA